MMSINLNIYSSCNACFYIKSNLRPTIEVTQKISLGSENPTVEIVSFGLIGIPSLDGMYEDLYGRVRTIQSYQSELKQLNASSNKKVIMGLLCCALGVAACAIKPDMQENRFFYSISLSAIVLIAQQTFDESRRLRKKEKAVNDAIRELKVKLIYYHNQCEEILSKLRSEKNQSIIAIAHTVAQMMNRERSNEDPASAEDKIRQDSFNKNKVLLEALSGRISYVKDQMKQVDNFFRRFGISRNLQKKH